MNNNQLQRTPGLLHAHNIHALISRGRDDFTNALVKSRHLVSDRRSCRQHNFVLNETDTNQARRSELLGPCWDAVGLDFEPLALCSRGGLLCDRQRAVRGRISKKFGCVEISVCLKKVKSTHGVTEPKRMRLASARASAGRWASRRLSRLSSSDAMLSVVGRKSERGKLLTRHFLDAHSGSSRALRGDLGGR